MTSAQSLEVRSLDDPDETRYFTDCGHIDLVRIGGLVAGRSTFEPGYRWSLHNRPIAGTASCLTSHNGYVVSGRMAIEMNDGTRAEVGPGDVFVIAPGHDAWTLGDEPCIAIDFGGYLNFGRRQDHEQEEQ